MSKPISVATGFGWAADSGGLLQKPEAIRSQVSRLVHPLDRERQLILAWQPRFCIIPIPNGPAVDGSVVVFEAL
jgi:hypothetical protein